MPTIKITDGFVWAVLAPEEATEAFAENSLFILYEDGSEAEIETHAEFDEARNKGLVLGIELAHEEELRSEWQEAAARNNETRSFAAWLTDKAENLIN